MDFSTRAVADVVHLLRFRARRVRRGVAHRWVMAAMLGGTLLVAVVPALVPGAGEDRRALSALTLLPVAFAAFLAIAVISAVVSGGGRELLPRDQATPYPISPTTDHLGALLLAPVNTAWLLQAWVLLGSAAYGLGARWDLAALQVVVLVWLLVATSLAQVLAWTSEAVRRRRHGIVVMRTVSVAVLVVAGWLHVQHQLVPVLDRVPTVWFVVGGIDGFSWRWALTVAVEIVLVVTATLLGVVPVHIAARRSARDELRVESETRAALPNPRTDLLALVRTDRSSVWRTVPMRRGILVLAIGPGLVAIAGDLPWHAMTILPGLVASGGALLFGVNAWCLDGRGGLWRESLPVSPQTVFTARAVVLAEFLLVASVITIVLASVRAGIPSAPEMAALVATLLVVTVQVVAAGMRWSARRPFAVDLRSARATPAPPAMMVAYSGRLAVSTTLTSLVFSGLARTPSWEISLVMAVPFLAWSTARLLRTGRAWTDPVQRARVVVSVAA
ncbi:hypothetical protein [Nocardioides sp.]|uniref:hypothetical protein n=1 Tax=Nocardioides sp. TaxID=35761 RepID=UPI002D7E4D79|nr:hypothetical protein [Nocardioides sp.]HET8961749.1 hypothetical protein [Nocardioides sp.]